MARMLATTLIRQPVSHVFEYVTTPGNWPRWQVSSLAVSGETNHSLRVGEQVTEELLRAGRLERAVWTVTEWRAPYRWVLDGELAGSGNRVHVAYTLQARDDGATVFEYEVTYQFGNPLRALGYRLFDQPRMHRELHDSVMRLRERLEALAGSSPLVGEAG